ncbi:hypothetical protein [Kitasatospora sp. NPDC058046]|uniref:hypothetical protein n=1 Tax=Kitasatospora sp. NPDC058046 TaxID=3346312 RepID=UPI0036DE9652
MTATVRSAPDRPAHRHSGAPQSPAPSGGPARLLMTGPRTALTAQARRAVGTVTRALLVLQDGDIAHALAHWLPSAAPDARLVGVHGLGERAAAGRAPAGSTLHADPVAVARALHAPGPALAVTTLAGAEVVADAHRARRLGPWQLLLIEDVLALQATGTAAGDLLSDAAVPAARRLLQTTATSMVDQAGQLWAAAPGPRYGRLRELGPPTARGWRLELPLDAPARPTDGIARLDAAARLALDTAARPGIDRVAVYCPDEDTARRLTARAHALTDAPHRRAPAPVVLLAASQPPYERARNLARLAGGCRAVVVTCSPLPTAVDAVMLLAPGRMPWTALAALERALPHPGNDLLVLTGRLELRAPDQRTTDLRTARADLRDATVVLATLAALDPRLRRALAHTPAAPAADPWAPGGALDRVLLPASLSPDHRRTVARVLLQADTPRTRPGRDADDLPTTGPAPPRTGPQPDAAWDTSPVPHP